MRLRGTKPNDVMRIPSLRSLLLSSFAAGFTLTLSAELLSLNIRSRDPVHSALAIDINIGPPPTPVKADGATHLLYEIRLTNFSAKEIRLIELELYRDLEHTAFRIYRADILSSVVAAVGPTTFPNDLTLRGGKSAMLFMDLTIPEACQTPRQLRHRFLFSTIGRKRGRVKQVVNGPVLDVMPHAPLILEAPLRGSNWVAGNALFHPDHRRALLAFDGRVRIAQRFAIDWVQLGSDGCIFRRNPRHNQHFYGYGAPVYAVAGGRIASLCDGLQEHQGYSERSDRNITLANLAGNFLILDLGDGRFVLYAHLQQGSIHKKLGAQVCAGDLLARLGNSGNSDYPHLHFQVMDANSTIGAEGLPFVFRRFEQSGIVTTPEEMDKGAPWFPAADAKPSVRQCEFPLDNAVITFP